MSAALLLLAIAAQATPALRSGDMDFRPRREGEAEKCVFVEYRRVPKTKKSQARYVEVCRQDCPKGTRPVYTPDRREVSGVCVPETVTCFYGPTNNPFQPWMCYQACHPGRHPEPSDWPKDGDWLCAEDGK